MTIRDYLKQGRMLDKRIQYDLEKLEETRAMARSLPAPAIDGMRVQTSRAAEAYFTRAVARISELEERISAEADLLMELKNQIYQVISRLDREELQLLLCYKYLDGMSLNEIGLHLHASVSTVKSWHRSALERLRMPENPIIIGITEPAPCA